MKFMQAFFWPYQEKKVSLRAILYKIVRHILYETFQDANIHFCSFGPFGLHFNLLSKGGLPEGIRAFVVSRPSRSAELQNRRQPD
jgi:hypothetical protein